MPITIKSNLVKIRDNPNAAYTSMDVISDSITAERVNQINNASTIAQAQIENKKNTVLNNIPADYITLTNNVEDFKDNIVVISDEEPQTEDTKVWINPYVEEMQVPTYAEYNNLNQTVALQQTQINNKASISLLNSETERARAKEAQLESMFTTPTQEAISNWLDAHPEATTTVQDGSLTESKFSNSLKTKTIKDYVTPEMFGAVGDGTTNDYNSFKDCADYAKNNGCDIVVPRKSYYLDGAQSIELLSNVRCLGSTFIVGDSHKKTYNPLFAYSHDTETATVQGVVSDFLVSNYEVTSAYKNKFFILDTKISYGTPIAQEAPSDETIQETICANDSKTYVYYSDISDHLSDAAELLHVSDISEIGYTFSGAIIKQKNEAGYGVCFLLINRNNIHICDVQIEANNVLGQGSVFNCRNCANVSFDNIFSYSEQPEIWGYEISATYCANLLVNNFKGYNKWSSIATRGLKNYTLSNSISTTFDCHWNAFGKFICDNNILYKDAHIGYGKGTFIVKNTVCEYVTTRMDYQQIWAGQIVVKDTTTKDGIRLQIGDSSASDYDTFFDDIILPKLHLNNVKTDERILYLRIPDNTSTRIVKNWLLIENCEFTLISIPYENIGYNAILSNVPFAVGTRSALARGANIVRDELYSQAIELTLSKLTSSTSIVSKNGNAVCVNVTGILSEAIDAWGSLGVIPVGYRPKGAVCCVGIYGSDPVAVNIATSGVISLIQPLSETGKRLSFSIAYTTNLVTI